MEKILITGATGNVGFEVISYLAQLSQLNTIVAGVRSVEKAKELITFKGVEFREFDFERTDTYSNALNGIDTVFLLRPPHISDVENIFRPLLASFTKHKVNKIVFLSVQGAEKSSIIPHNKIEKMICNFGFEYIFLRPSYFMQNLTTTLIGDIKQNRSIALPAGRAKFNWVDIKNIAEVAAILINRFDDFKGKKVEITGYENENFSKVVELINQQVASPIRYLSVNPIKFYKIKKKSGMAKGMILVMIFLHFLPRFQKDPNISTFFEDLTGRKPTNLRDFIKREVDKFID
jgi:uncharacterized protein YbjT (DUF2867 family)